MCHSLRHDGVDYSEYVSQLSYLLFFKMLSEKSSVAGGEWNPWKSIIGAVGENSLVELRYAFKHASELTSPIGDIFKGAECRFSSSSTARRVVEAVDELDWSTGEVDVKALVYESLLARAANEGKRGAGQYFTPRPLVRAIVRCVKPGVERTTSAPYIVLDPSCGTGGFLTEAWSYCIERYRTARLSEPLEGLQFAGTELVDRVRTLTLMNMMLHEVPAEINLGDALQTRHYADGSVDVVLGNPPFGSRGGAGSGAALDVEIRTSSKQLNFLQLAVRQLKDGGRAAMILPDSVITSRTGRLVLYSIMGTADVHTILINPEGTFSPYAPGINTVVLFLNKGIATRKVWVYDQRSQIDRVNTKGNPLTASLFDEFVSLYGEDPLQPHGRRRDDAQSERWKVLDSNDLVTGSFRQLPLRRSQVSNGAGGTPAVETLASLIDGLRDLEDRLGAVLRQFS